MLYSVQLYTEARHNRRDLLSTTREHVTTIRCSELRCNGQPVAYAIRNSSRFTGKVTLAKVYALENNGKSSRWKQIEARML